MGSRTILNTLNDDYIDSVAVMPTFPVAMLNDPVVKLMLQYGVIDQRYSSQMCRDEALAELITSGDIARAQVTGLINVFNDKRGMVVSLVPQVGMGATLTLWTDAHAFEVIAVSKSGHRATLRQLKAERDPSWKRDFAPGSFFGHTYNDHELKYKYSTDESGTLQVIGRRKDGTYKASGWRGCRVGSAHEHYDSNF